MQPWFTASRFTLILSTSVFILSVPIDAQHWPNWRGPAASGVSPATNLPVSWSDTQNIAWKAPLRGLGVSSPIVWGDLVLVTSQVGSGEARSGPRLVQTGNPMDEGERPLGSGPTSGSGRVSFVVSAFDRVSGRPAWEFELPAEGSLPFVHEKHNLASPSPATDGERVYAWFGTGQIAALDLQGKLVWKKNLATDYEAFEINWGHGSSPIVHGDMLVLVSYHENTSYLLALDARTGAVRWKADEERGTTSYSTPAIVDAGGRTEIVINTSAGIRAHDAATGKRLWYINETNRFPVPSPLVHDGLIYTSRGYRSSPFLAIRPGGSGDVSASHVVWRVPSGAPYISSLVHYEGLIYMVGDVGVLTVTDAGTGERVHQERIGGVYTASPVAGNGKVYLTSEDGEMIVISAGRTPRVLARNTLPVRLLASPALTTGRLFIRSDDTLYAIGQ